MNELWKLDAACRKAKVPMLDFFDNYERSVEVQHRIDSLCASCPVETQCLEWAIEEKLEGGVFGRKFIQPKHKTRNKKR